MLRAEQPPVLEHVDWVATGACFVFASLGPVLFGYDIGVSRGAMISLAAEIATGNSIEDPHRRLDSWLLSFLPTTSMLGALVASLLIMLCGNVMGRRTELLIAAMVYGISSLLVNLDVDLAHVLALRFAFGLANGLSIHASAAFIAETCPSCVRGTLICLKEAMLVGGILKGYLVANLFEEQPGGWRAMYSAAAPVAAAMWLGVWFLPESPRWLLLADYKAAVAAGRAPGGSHATTPLGGSPRLGPRGGAPRAPRPLAEPLLWHAHAHGHGHPDPDSATTSPHGAPGAAGVARGGGRALRVGLLRAARGAAHGHPNPDRAPTAPQGVPGAQGAGGAGGHAPPRAAGLRSLLTLPLLFGQPQPDPESDLESPDRDGGADPDLLGSSGEAPVLSMIDDTAYGVAGSSSQEQRKAQQQHWGGHASTSAAAAPVASGRQGGRFGRFRGGGMGGRFGRVWGASWAGPEAVLPGGALPHVLTQQPSQLPHVLTQQPSQPPLPHALTQQPSQPPLPHVLTQQPSQPPLPHVPTQQPSQPPLQPPQQQGQQGQGGESMEVVVRAMLARQVRHGFWPQRRQIGQMPGSSLQAARARAGAPPSGLPRIPSGGSSEADNSGSSSSGSREPSPTTAGDGASTSAGEAGQHSEGYVRARAALLRAWGSRARWLPRAVDDEMSAIALSACEATISGIEGPVRMFGHRLYYRPLAVGLLLMLFQQVTGQPAVMAGSRSILEAAGVTQRVDEIVGLFRLLVTLTAASAVDAWGRRPILLLGASGMVFALLALGGVQLPAAAAFATPGQVAWASVCSMLVFLACFQLSWGPISWLYCGEIFPLGIRGPAIAASNACGFLSSIVVSLLLPSVQEAVGPSGTYIVCAVVSLLAVLIVHLLVPETKGKTLEEIEMFWGGDRLPSFETSSFSEWLP
ncbi:hypothetical protein FOA52_011206 [Chlamydomonas sp. UWO 241]|nr:hypothetical protein FOA52_011206 [Chlamydomonas sp. UWO 241]